GRDVVRRSVDGIARQSLARIGLLQAFTTAALSLPTMSAGIPRGPESANQTSATSDAKPCSAKVGTSGKSGTRLRDVTASARTFPPRIVPAADVSAVQVTAMWPPM